MTRGWKIAIASAVAFIILTFAISVVLLKAGVEEGEEGRAQTGGAGRRDPAVVARHF